ncbi:MAG TPA: serine/threonine-protein kinase, partial [Minicystis sp.]|nr:serine/threonine-protein kinase [Minicystis sp.]
MTESEKLKPGAIVADRFRLEQRLGQGGMGSVWRAQHLGLDIACAVKFLRREAADSPDLRGRFEREAKAAARLKSPHVVQILDHGVWDGVPYIAMEYLEGEDLNQRLKRVRRLDARETVRIAAQVARALAKAHAAGLVHRDLKPSNIFLTRDEEHEVAKVLDFGVAKRSVTSESAAEQETKSGSILGTPHYMSPEQAQGTKVVDHRSDLWSLAVVVYQCLTGQLPYRSDALGDLLVQIIVSAPPVPSHVAALPASFDAWWARAVAREPAQRFQSARELVTALAASLAVAPELPVDGAETASFNIPPSLAPRTLDPRG